MSALDLISGTTQAIYVIVFVLLLVRLSQQPTRAHTDMTLFFGATTVIIVASGIVALFPAVPREAEMTLAIGLLMALPYLLLRIVDDFTIVSSLVKRIVEAGLLVSIAAAIVFANTLPAPVALAMVVYFAAVSGYCAGQFMLHARRSLGVTRRRLEAAALGTILIGADLLFAGLDPFLAEPEHTVVAALAQLCGLGSAVGYYVAFAPPAFLRHAWQAPELRAFLGRAAVLPRLPSMPDIVREMELGAASSTGATARIGLWSEMEGVIRFRRDAEHLGTELRPGERIAGRAFAEQRAIYSGDPPRDDPAAAERYRAADVGALICVPITAGERRLGVLTLYAERPPIFAVSDIELAQLLADQAAVVLESRALIADVARVRAREEATRLKEEFLAAAAHDLKTPLTTVVAQAEFLERKVLRDPTAPPDVQGIRRIVREAKRLAGLVTELLDASRLEQGKLVTEREPVDLGALVSEAIDRLPASGHAVAVEVRGAVVGSYDRRRIDQLVDNLVENAMKYSPAATDIGVAVWQEDGSARLSVTDHGIGIPAADLPSIFERFSRASNVDDRRFHGMGLGLYICRGIVEEHGGRIWAESEVGKGSTFHVALPIADDASAV